MTSTAQVDALISSTTARMGRLDVLVNNAGLGGQTPVVDMTDEDWDRVLNVTLTSVMARPVRRCGTSATPTTAA